MIFIWLVFPKYLYVLQLESMVKKRKWIAVSSKLLESWDVLGRAVYKSLSQRKSPVKDFSQIVLCLKILIISKILFFFLCYNMFSPDAGITSRTA